ncbi:uncharacterized protein LTR77_006753 [Saxophila tyrrhenica]|uniref:NADH:flavin oxidoreductase/NADH oxidase N-terminal domain-containing protein n=1 Tax=Saxophila tyrrhenica TaxID=1690608 RepID=A0AAV9P5J0_9PEZI|nr:hypothetical protein LTR77_006753 [Saxophila tyrrhenica]
MATLSFPVSVGAMRLQHRVVLAPMTRYRADANNVPLHFVKEYCAQRAAVPGTLLITEGTFISPRAGGFKHVPGIYTAAQVKAWRDVTDAVHAAGSFVFCQLWGLGRAANPEALQDSGNRLLSASNIRMSDNAPEPEAMAEGDIFGFIQDYVAAAMNAMKAGFDGVEIHGANGYLPDQFTQSNSNSRDDAWGGDVERRARFGIEVARAVADAIGPERIEYRISPWSPFQGMGMSDPKPQFSYLAMRLSELGLVYLHVVEPRISGADTIEAADEEVDFLVDI